MPIQMIVTKMRARDRGTSSYDFKIQPKIQGQNPYKITGVNLVYHYLPVLSESFHET
jgi:hypothetical protein